MKFLISLIIVLLVSSCTLLDSGVKVFKDNVEISLKSDKSKIPVDSILIKFEPVYWKENIVIDTTHPFILSQEGTEKEWKQDGYSIWVLQSGNMRRIEVKKLDTMIYLWKK